MSEAASSPRPDADRRHLPRQRTLKGALVVFGTMSRTFDCQVRNLTDKGAKLTLASTLGVPHEFHLAVLQDGKMAPARTVWRNEREVGIAFTGPWRPYHIPAIG